MQKDNLHFEGVEHREVHNIYGALCQKSTRQGLIQRDEKRNGGDGARPFSLSRAFFIGSQKLGAIWTGKALFLFPSLPILFSPPSF